MVGGSFLFTVGICLLSTCWAGLELGVSFEQQVEFLLVSRSCHPSSYHNVPFTQAHGVAESSLFLCHMQR